MWRANERRTRDSLQGPLSKGGATMYDLSLDRTRVILEALVGIRPYVDLEELSRVEECLVG